MGFDLEQRDLDDLTNVGKISLGYPHAFLNSSIVRKFVYGERLQSMAKRPESARGLMM
jgi:hypothetical protein